MDAYVRFQSQLRCGNTGRPAGVFATAGRVEDAARTPDSTRERLRDSLAWFNQNLIVPRLGECCWRCVFWFHSDATELIRRIWELVAILEDEGVFTRKIWTTDPGRIYYFDEYQVAAIPHRKSDALRL